MKCYAIQAAVAVAIAVSAVILLGLSVAISSLATHLTGGRIFKALDRAALPILLVLLGISVAGLLWSYAGDITRTWFHWCVQ